MDEEWLREISHNKYSLCLGTQSTHTPEPNPNYKVQVSLLHAPILLSLIPFYILEENAL
jgi:hypothetical protein